MDYSQDTILPLVDELNVFEHGRFVLSNIAAKRAKQIKDGAAPLVDLPSIHPLSLALCEIGSQKIKATLKALDHDEKLIVDEVMTDPSQLGLLLPSLDDLDIQSSLLPEDELDIKHEIHEMSLEELLLVEDPTIETDNITQDELGTISLNELEDQENLEENLDNHQDLD